MDNFEKIARSLERFLLAQEDSYEAAIDEIKQEKREVTGCGISFRRSKD